MRNGHVLKTGSFADLSARGRDTGSSELVCRGPGAEAAGRGLHRSPPRWREGPERAGIRPHAFDWRRSEAGSEDFRRPVSP